MNWKQKCIYFIVVALFIFASVHTVHSKEGNEGTTIGYNANQKIEMHEMKVVVIGDGYILDNEYKIHDYTMNYQLKEGDLKTFKIQANKKSRLKSVVFNAKDITTSVDLKNEIKVIATNYDSVLVVTFETMKIDSGEVEKPIIPPNEEELIEKEIITIIVKDIILKDIVDEIDDEFLRRYIVSNLGYKILSHNVQKKLGTYDIAVELSDGSVQTLKINVIADEREKNIAAYNNEQCNIHWMTLFLLILFIVYSLYIYYHNYKKIKTIKRYVLPKTKDMSKTKDHIYLITAGILQFLISYLFYFSSCSLDIFIYWVSSIVIICLVMISQVQQYSYRKILNHYIDLE